MKNTRNFFLFIFLFFIFLNPADGAELTELLDQFNFSANITGIGGGVNFTANYRIFELSLSLGDFFAEHKKTHIGMELSLLKYSIFYFFSYASMHRDKIFFINTSLYWDALPRDDLLLGPFFSIQYLSVDNLLRADRVGFNAREILFSAGAKFIWKPQGKLAVWPLEVVGCEAGYRAIFGNSGVYFLLKLSSPF
ncbi:MAG: hypothetical protein LBT95_10460 [Treponema sp.]|jgi:hypothetical protein|nr:hypothetical protein [Treponema sp.]